MTSQNKGRPRVMFVSLEPARVIVDPNQAYNGLYNSCGMVVEGNWDNMPSLGVSVCVIKDTRFGQTFVYTEETIREGIERLKQADLIVGYNLRAFAYLVLSPYSAFSLQHLPTFDMQEEIAFLTTQKAEGEHWVAARQKAPRISLSNIAKYTCDISIAHAQDMPQIWAEGKKEQVVSYVKRRVEALQKVFYHACRHGCVSYWLKGAKDSTILETPDWAKKARNMVESVTPKRSILGVGEPVSADDFEPAPEQMFLSPNPKQERFYNKLSANPVECNEMPKIEKPLGFGSPKPRQLLLF